MVAPVGTMMNDDVIPLVLEFELTGLEMAWFVGSLACMQACVMVILRERERERCRAGGRVVGVPEVGVRLQGRPLPGPPPGPAHLGSPPPPHVDDYGC